MKPGSVTALKQLQEKLALWSTWDETKKEWESAVLEWCRGTDTLKTKKNLDVGIIYANRRECDRDNTYASLVPRIIDWYAPEEGPEREEFIDSLKLFSLLANVADMKSLVIHPYTTTHSQMTPEELEQQHITPTTVRLSIGVEHIDDILADLSQAFDKI